MRRIMVQIVAAVAVIGGVGVAAAGIAQAAPLPIGGVGDPSASQGAPGQGSSDPGAPLGGLAGGLPKL
jgi:hypothetical protein